MTQELVLAKNDIKPRILIEVGTAGSQIEIVRSPRGDVFVHFFAAGHWQTSRIESAVGRYVIAQTLGNGKAYRANVDENVQQLSGRAQFDARVVPVFRRIGTLDGLVYVDLGDESGNAIEVSPDGWGLVSTPPVLFERPNGMLGLPSPHAGGDIQELRPFVNVQTDEDFIALVSFIVGCFNPSGPYPLLVVNGPEGSAKSTMGRIVRTLTDPNSAALSSEPKDAWSLMVSAETSRMLGYDNLSHAPQWLSDALSSLTTGGAYRVRKNYGDREEVIFDAQVPVITTSITNLFTRGDLLSRSVVLRLPPITQPKTEAALRQGFNEVSGRLLGVILDGVAAALRNAHREFQSPTRMADFLAWATGASEAFGWSPDEVLTSLANRAEDNAGLAIDSAAMGPVLCEIAGVGFEGTNEALLTECERKVPSEKRGVGWPNGPRGMRNALDRLEGSLAVNGFRIAYRKAGGLRLVRLWRELAEE